jgi:peptidoglycan/xylan/chitin deacetylase (PgdA/CDA1 family)
MSQDPILLVGRDARPSLFSAGRYGANPDGVTDSTAAFIAAAAYATSQGVDFIVCPAGTYHCPGMTCDDMGGVYIVGDGVTFTPTTYVAAFTVRDWVERSAEGPPAERGMIAIECDDAYPSEWQYLFPLSKELGIPLGSAVITSKYTAGNAPWLKEMHRHGWELLSHTDTHDSLATATAEEIHTECATSLAIIQAITGKDKVAFVYPGHERNVASDMICRNYFTNGRGLSITHSHHSSAPQQWLLTSTALDTILSDVGAAAETEFTEAFLQRLDSIATGNQSALFFMHFQSGDATDQKKLLGLRKLVAHCKARGIRIVRPSELYPSTQLIRNPHANAGWTLNGTGLSLDETTGYFAGKSIKYVNASAGNFYFKHNVPIHIARPGHFAVVKASFRYKAPSDVTVGAGLGLSWLLEGDQRKFTAAGASDSSLALSATAWTRLYPLTGTTIAAAADWTLVEAILLIPPELISFKLVLNGNTITAPDGIWFDELRCELMDYVTSRTIVTTINGTSQRKIYPGIAAGYYGVVASPQSVHTGPIRIAPSGAACFLYSATAGDLGAVAVTFFPRSSYVALDDLSMPPV